MWEMLWPILLILLSNTVYNICTKSTPGNVNAFGALMITYAVATIFTAVIFVFLVKPENVFIELSHVNWTSVVLGMVIVGLELGYIFAYRAGWKVSSASLVANIGLAIVLIFVGAVLYGENITLKQVMGILICCVGLFLINMG
ncbi:MAG: EamA family transporter [Methanobrevibacter ruminantium]|uniref:EamA family transporter n=1 Tax=Methanobrevibacter ruminantium TaxID=83816 RepID=UPI0026EA7D98|nr:EamA family transporter [Methanobrevibacter ruminantium]MCI5737380.1 EamA family transporter [Methanobrevibacter ruminantium]MDD6048376.1 EamA family transporter [Methanobrevibacter ruminantium]MDO5842556.1 EamA family transporter [Methanobrevibacter ruminantium]